MYNKKIKFDHNLQNFIDCEYPDPSSCVKHQVHELEDIHDQYGGFPKTYVFENTIIQQRWWKEDEIDFEFIGNFIGMEAVTITSRTSGSLAQRYIFPIEKEIS